MLVRKGGLPCRSKGRREKEEQRKRKRSRERGAGLLIWCSQENKKSVKTFGAAKSDKRSGKLGWIRVWLGKEISHPLSTFLHSHLFFLCIHTHLQRIISLYIHTYIYPYLYKVISITLKEHIRSIISHASYIVKTPTIIYLIT